VLVQEARWGDAEWRRPRVGGAYGTGGAGRTGTLCLPKQKLLVEQRLRGLDMELVTLSSCGCPGRRWWDAWQWLP
jgi:hypothetical protein